jgi:hypothetical protein
MNTPLLIITAFVAPLILAAAMGFPTWIAARTNENYLKLRDDYRTAVGRPAVSPAPQSSTTYALPKWVTGYYVYLIITGILRAIHPTLGFTAHVLIFAGFAFWFIQKAFRSFAILKSHPYLETRLRRVPVVEIVTWSVVGFIFLMIVHFMIVIEAPQEFEEHQRKLS